MKNVFGKVLLIAFMAVNSNIYGSLTNNYSKRVVSNDTIIEEDIIKHRVEQYYIKGLQTRDFNLIRSICIEEAKLYGVRKDSSLNITTLDNWSKNFNPEKPPFRSLEYKILKIDYVGTAAQVKILFIVNGKNHIHDYLNLLKINGKWMIVNIIDF